MNKREHLALFAADFRKHIAERTETTGRDAPVDTVTDEQSASRILPPGGA